MALRSPAETASPTSARAVFASNASAPPAPETDGAWWPRSRTLATELPAFIAAWPAERGRIQRILYSAPDWDDHPHSVDVPGRRVKTGTFPRDDTHVLTVSMADRTDHLIRVIAPGTSEAAARRALDGTAPAPVGDPIPRWVGEGGSLRDPQR